MDRLVDHRSPLRAVAAAVAGAVLPSTPLSPFPPTDDPAAAIDALLRQVEQTVRATIDRNRRMS